MNLDTLSIPASTAEAAGTTCAEPLLDAAALQAALAEATTPVPLLRQTLQHSSAVLDQRYRQNLDISAIVAGRAQVVDQVLRLAWECQQWPDTDDISLIAVGGYGRGELLPGSDIDLLILTRTRHNVRYQDGISAFLTLLWDIGLKVGHSVRSLQQCRQEAVKDITVATALMESRTISGPPALHRQMLALTNNERTWPTKKFLRAKLDEQMQRHNKYHDVDYALEPNVKTSPGGLRDIQTIAWVTRRHFGAVSFQDLADLGFLKPSEQAMIRQGQQLLWKLRYGLHLLAGRCEDRLLFDKQRELARWFGYQDDDKSLGVEKLMKQYYRMVAKLRELNDVLLQHLDEAILRAGEQEKIKPLNQRFQIRNDCIEAIDSRVFQRHPFALLEIFVLMAQDPGIDRIRASTIRLLRDHRHTIDDAFRHDIRSVSLFMALLRSPHKMSLQLRRMARYGILGRYLPEFGQITGQMQHDLFHIYTVDAHTLQVVENMRRFLLPAAEEQFPLAAQIIRQLPKLELLYIAGLYHDIAKGRGSDHSRLGQVDADNFCRRHRLKPRDSKLVVWLVGQHLLMSMTAQRKDISDPEVIQEFAGQVGDKLHLDYLYVMTVADICATNPGLWNSWRNSLMTQLYLHTSRALQQGLESPVDQQAGIVDKRQTAYRQLQDLGLTDQAIDKVWQNAAEEYFVREAIANIVWHTEVIAAFDGEGPLIAIRETIADHSGEGVTQIFIYTRNADFLFANSTAAFEKLQLNIHGARIFTSVNDFCMDTYTVLETDGKSVGNQPARRQEIRQVLAEYLRRGQQPVAPASLRRSRKARYFSKPVETSFIEPGNKPYSTLELNCPDQPGILACVGKVFAENRIRLQDARITTLGERIEDLFFITDQHGQPITDAAVQQHLQQQIKHQLQSRLAN